MLAGASALAGCGITAGDGASGYAGLRSAPGATTVGPAADYPVVIGEPYRVGQVTYTPADTLNYDQVGYAAADTGTAGVSGAHHTLPLPSYVEVTSLATGRTILARLERRGPMDSDALVALSPAALAQLEASAGTPVRVRRVNPPEDHRALLRAGQSAPLRMDTPETLVSVLRRKLPKAGSVSLAAPEAASATEITSISEPTEAVELPPDSTTESAPPPLPPLATAVERTAPSPAFEQGFAPAVSREDGFVVQAAAFSTRDRAQKAATVLGGQVSQAGRYYRVRTGPFATRGQAEASLAKVRAAGYRDARIFTKG